MSQWKLLFVDDSDLDVMLSVRAIRAAGQEFVHARVDCADDFADRLAGEHWDAVVCDHQMPVFDALSAVRLLAAGGHDIPLLIVSGAMPNELAIAAMREGARDFISKEHLSRLAPAIERELRAAQNRAHLRQAQSSIERLLHVDQLTGLPNGDALHLRLREFVAGGGVGALVLFDVGRFRRLKQSHGVVQANRVLRAMASRLARQFPGDAVVARVASGRFALLLPGLTTAAALADVFARLDTMTAEPFDVDGSELPATACYGASLHPSLARDASELVRQAETALDFAKRERSEGSSCGRVYAAGMGMAVARQRLLEASLYRATINEAFQLCYQPQFEFGGAGADGVRRPRLIGLEALLRWRDDAGVLVPAVEFIRTLDDTGMILSVGEWVLAEAARRQAEWRAAGLPVPRLAINLSSRQLRLAEFASATLATIRQAGGDPAGFEFEFSESGAMGSEEVLIAQLGELRRAGAGVAIGNFGGGYSSLSWLGEFPLDRLKLDKRIVAAAEPRTIRAIVALAHELGVAVSGEGIETAAQAEALAAAGCTAGQGNLWAAALPPAEVGEWLARVSD